MGLPMWRKFRHHLVARLWETYRLPLAGFVVFVLVFFIALSIVSPGVRGVSQGIEDWFNCIFPFYSPPGLCG